MDEKRLEKARVLSSRQVYEGRVITLDVDEVDEPGGVRATREVARHPGSVAVLAKDAEGRIVVVRQYRFAVDATLWELPAGRVDPGESPEQAARRELEEEVGLVARRLTPLTRFYTTPGFCDEVMDVFRAEGLISVPARPEPDERIEARWLRRDEAWDMIERGEIREGKTLVALLLEEIRLLREEKGASS